MTDRRHLKSRAAAIAVAATVLGLGACSGSATSGSQSAAGVAVDSPAAEAKPERVVGAAPSAGLPNADGSSQVGAPAADPAIAPKIVKNAALALQVEQIGPAAAKIRTAVAGLGGHVTNETVNVTDAAPVTPLPGVPRADATYAVPRVGNYGQLTFAVPADKLELAIDAVASVGTVVQRTSSSTDVTATYIDTETRITTKKASIERIRALMAQTQNISQVVELETQLASREAELESLQAQLNALKDHVAMSTLTVVISTTAAGTVTPNPDSGFVAGLKSAWSSFLKSLTTLLEALAAALPWAAILALVAVPLWRRRRASAAATLPRATAADPAPTAPIATHPPVSPTAAEAQPKRSAPEQEAAPGS